jgi:hypothetical protein
MKVEQFTSAAADLRSPRPEDNRIGEPVVAVVKAFERILSLHKVQLGGYQKPGGYRPGHLLNCDAARVRDGIVRTANGC